MPRASVGSHAGEVVGQLSSSEVAGAYWGAQGAGGSSSRGDASKGGVASFAQRSKATKWSQKGRCLAVPFLGPWAFVEDAEKQVVFLVSVSGPFGGPKIRDNFLWVVLGAQAMAVFQWANSATAAAGRPPLLLNMDEMSAGYHFAGLTGSPGGGGPSDEASLSDVRGYVSFWQLLQMTLQFNRYSHKSFCATSIDSHVRLCEVWPVLAQTTCSFGDRSLRGTPTPQCVPICAC